MSKLSATAVADQVYALFAKADIPGIAALSEEKADDWAWNGDKGPVKYDNFLAFAQGTLARIPKYWPEFKVEPVKAMESADGLECFYKVKATFGAKAPIPETHFGHYWRLNPKTGKVIEWYGYDDGAAFAANAQDQDEILITKAEGEKLANDWLAACNTCMAANDFEPMRSMHAETLEWDWSGNVHGIGTYDQYLEVLKGSWQALCSHFVPSNIQVVVDGKKGIVAATFDIVLVVNGRGAVPVTEKSVFQGRNLFELHVNADKKVTLFRGIWDPVDPKLGAAIGDVVTAFGAAAAASESA